ncbi:MAG: T9SS type A sorting domain-containing protein [Ignavibacteriaceae bacterium]
MKKLLLFLFLGFLLFSGMLTETYSQLSGIYSVGVNTISGEAGNYATLSAAVTALNASGVNGPCIFYFTDIATYSDTAISLGCTGTSATNTITFKPYTGVTATLSLTSTFLKNIDGSFVIGSPNNLNSNLVSTNYVTIDGSNTVGGTTRNLIIENPVTALTISPIRIFGDNNFITIKNCVIKNRSTSSTATSPINVTNYNNGSLNFTPNDIIIENDSLLNGSATGLAGIQASNSGTPGTFTTITIRNTYLNAVTRGIFINYCGSADIYNNTISMKDERGAGAGAGIVMMQGGAAAGTFNIYGNRFIRLNTPCNTAAASNGMIGIDNQLAAPKVVNIYNNFIAGFEVNSAAVKNAKIYGIRQTGASTSNIYYNTIYIPELTNMTDFGTSYIAGIVFASTSEVSPGASAVGTVKNNIIYANESTMKVFCIRRGGSTGTFTSDYNDLYYNSGNTSGYVGMYNAVDQQTLQNWIDNTTYDDNSKSVNVTFTSATDLHLAGGSIGDVNLIGTPIVGYTKDFDNQDRHATSPYMGADENTDSPLPVELMALNYRFNHGFVDISWSTVTEVNASRFEIERKSASSDWTKIGEVAASGNSNSPKEYMFTDNSVTSGQIVYRLKIVDNDGSFAYSKEIEVENLQPSTYQLSQNYPNPFNPTTTISYQIPAESNVKLLLFSVTGELVRELVNSNQSAGSYNVTLDASGLASGTYIYRLVASDFVSVKKMVVLK